MVTGAGAGPRAGRLRRERALGPSAALDMALRRRPALALLLLLRGESAGLRRARPEGSGRSGGRARGPGSGRCGGSWVQGGESRGCGGPDMYGVRDVGVREGQGAAPKVRGPQRCGPRVGVGVAGRGRGAGVGGPRGRESWRSGCRASRGAGSGPGPVALRSITPRTKPTRSRSPLSRRRPALQPALEWPGGGSDGALVCPSSPQPTPNTPPNTPNPRLEAPGSRTARPHAGGRGRALGARDRGPT